MSVKKFSGAVGLTYLALGLFGIIPSFLPPVSSVPEIVAEVGVTRGYGNLLGVFPINAFEAIVYIVIGLAGLTALFGTEPFARLYADTLAVWLGLIGVLGLIPTANTLFGLMPIYGNDVWLHLGTAAIAAYFGFFLDRGRPGRDPSASDTYDTDPLERTPIKSDS